jgi:hypothetical protein
LGVVFALRPLVAAGVVAAVVAAVVEPAPPFELDDPHPAQSSSPPHASSAAMALFIDREVLMRADDRITAFAPRRSSPVGEHGAQRLDWPLR